MRAEKVLPHLMMASAEVASIAGDRVFAAHAPEGVAYPAVVCKQIDAVELATIDAASYGLMRSRIEVVALARSYAEVKACLEAVRVACNYKRGDIAGVPVQLIQRAGYGPDGWDDVVGLYFGSMDFYVLYFER
jgi:hypothetical protein